jgi:uncharacterized protein (TIGR03067 family)
MRAILAIFTGCLLLLADDVAELVKKDMAQLQGEWLMVSGEIDTFALPAEMVKTSKRVATGDETSLTLGGRPYFTAKFTIDPSKHPKTIDYAMTEGPTKGKTQLGIYAFDGDTVKFCFASPGKERPTEFKTSAGSGRTLSVWKRAKK